MSVRKKNFVVVICLPPTGQVLRFYATYVPPRNSTPLRTFIRSLVEEVQLGDVMAHVVVRVGENLIESAITRRSADELNLKKGDTVTAVVKATEVMIQKD
jgi:molybdopterin-binding protein